MAGAQIFETGDDDARGWHRLKPVKARWPWVTSGLILQLVGVAAPAAYVIIKAHHQDVTGRISKATLTLAWRQAVHSHAGLALLIGGATLFVVGSVLLARPYVKSWLTLFVAIPVAALVGVLLLGAAALIVALIVAALWSGDFIDWGSSSSAGKRKRTQDPDEAQPADAA